MEVHCLDVRPICHVPIYKFTEMAAPLLVTLSRILSCMIEFQVTSKLPHPMEASFLGNFSLLGIVAFYFILFFDSFGIQLDWSNPFVFILNLALVDHFDDLNTWMISQFGTGNIGQTSSYWTIIFMICFLCNVKYLATERLELGWVGWWGPLLDFVAGWAKLNQKTVVPCVFWAPTYPSPSPIV